jgi:hypothetical protein
VSGRKLWTQRLRYPGVTAGRPSVALRLGCAGRCRGRPGRCVPGKRLATPAVRSFEPTSRDHHCLPSETSQRIDDYAGPDASSEATNHDSRAGPRGTQTSRLTSHPTVSNRVSRFGVQHRGMARSRCLHDLRPRLGRTYRHQRVSADTRISGWADTSLKRLASTGSYRSSVGSCSRHG